MQQVVQIPPSSHPQPFRDPSHGHGRFLSQARRQCHLLRIPLAPCPEVGRLPCAPLQFLRDNPFRLGCLRFRPLLAVVLGTGPPAAMPASSTAPANTPANCPSGSSSRTGPPSLVSRVQDSGGRNRKRS